MGLEVMTVIGKN